MDKAPSYSELEMIAKEHGHIIEIENSSDGNLTIFRPVCSCGWTLTREQSGEIQLGWRYGKANAERIGMQHISDIGRKIIANESR